MSPPTFLPIKKGRTCAAKYTLQRQGDGNGVDDIRPVKGSIMCIPIGTEFKCEACWASPKNITEHWRDHCEDAVAFNRLKNMFAAENHTFYCSEYCKVAKHPNGISAKAILEINPATWTPYDKIPVRPGEHVPYKGKSYVDLLRHIITDDDKKEIEEVEQIKNYYSVAARRAYHSHEKYNKFLIQAWKDQKNEPFLQSALIDSLDSDGVILEILTTALSDEWARLKTPEDIRGYLQSRLQEWKQDAFKEVQLKKAITTTLTKPPARWGPVTKPLTRLTKPALPKKLTVADTTWLHDREWAKRKATGSDYDDEHESD